MQLSRQCGANVEKRKHLHIGRSKAINHGATHTWGRKESSLGAVAVRLLLVTVTYTLISRGAERHLTTTQATGKRRPPSRKYPIMYICTPVSSRIRNLMIL
eukprot:GHVT01017265.1.p1 GENE.GHVT01017265.1~~GHVT01017265.1.p1  ORF type:complete len:101 (-),score=3.18 GHVT01017265.1:854-1156(-)